MTEPLFETTHAATSNPAIAVLPLGMVSPDREVIFQDRSLPDLIGGWIAEEQRHADVLRSRHPELSADFILSRINDAAVFSGNRLVAVIQFHADRPATVTRFDRPEPASLVA